MFFKRFFHKPRQHDMLLWVGLGNPGDKYAGNRHNVGFMAVDSIAQDYGFGSEKKQFQGLVRDGVIHLEGRPVKVLILKPTTFMNESGRSVQKAMQYYKIPLENVTVFHDELDLAPGKVRVKKGGGIAGHNGLRSIRQHVGENFWRVRLGIGHPGHRDKVHTYVLSDFSKSERTWLKALLDAMATAAQYLAGGANDKFQTKVDLIAPPPSTGSRRQDQTKI